MSSPKFGCAALQTSVVLLLLLTGDAAKGNRIINNKNLRSPWRTSPELDEVNSRGILPGDEYTLDPDSKRRKHDTHIKRHVKQLGRMVDLNSGLWNLLRKIPVEDFDVERNGLSHNFNTYIREISKRADYRTMNEPEEKSENVYQISRKTLSYPNQQVTNLPTDDEIDRVTPSSIYQNFFKSYLGLRDDTTETSALKKSTTAETKIEKNTFPNIIYDRQPNKFISHNSYLRPAVSTSDDVLKTLLAKAQIGNQLINAKTISNLSPHYIDYENELQTRPLRHDYDYNINSHYNEDEYSGQPRQNNDYTNFADDNRHEATERLNYVNYANGLQVQAPRQDYDYNINNHYIGDEYAEQPTTNNDFENISDVYFHGAPEYPLEHNDYFNSPNMPRSYIISASYVDPNKQTVKRLLDPFVMGNKVENPRSHESIISDLETHIATKIRTLLDNNTGKNESNIITNPMSKQFVNDSDNGNSWSDIELNDEDDLTSTEPSSSFNIQSKDYNKDEIAFDENQYTSADNYINQWSQVSVGREAELDDHMYLANAELAQTSILETTASSSDTDINNSENITGRNAANYLPEFPEHVVQMVNNISHIITNGSSKIPFKTLYQRYKNIFDHAERVLFHGQPANNDLNPKSNNVNIQPKSETKENVGVPHKLIIVYRPVLFVSNENASGLTHILGKGYLPTVLTGNEEESASITKEVLDTLEPELLKNLREHFVANKTKAFTEEQHVLEEIQKDSSFLSDKPATIVSNIQNHDMNSNIGKNTESPDDPAYTAYSDAAYKPNVPVRVIKIKVEPPRLQHNDFSDSGININKNNMNEFMGGHINGTISAVHKFKMPVKIIRINAKDVSERHAGEIANPEDAISGVTNPTNILIDSPLIDEKNHENHIPLKPHVIRINANNLYNQTISNVSKNFLNNNVNTTENAVTVAPVSDKEFSELDKSRIKIIRVNTKKFNSNPIGFPLENENKANVLMDSSNNKVSGQNNRDTVSHGSGVTQTTDANYVTEFKHDSVGLQKDVNLTFQPVRYVHNIIVNLSSINKSRAEVQSPLQSLSKLEHVNPGMWWITKPANVTNGQPQYAIRRIIKRRKKIPSKMDGRRFQQEGIRESDFHSYSGVMVHQPHTGVMVHQPHSGVMVHQPHSGVMVHQPHTGVMVHQPHSGVMVHQAHSGVMVHQPHSGVMVHQTHGTSIDHQRRWV